MNKLILLKISPLFVAISLPVFVTAQEAPDPTKLKYIMQEMIVNTQLLTKGIFYEDYQQIMQAAKNIADHPEPGLTSKVKLMNYMGKEMVEFKKLDTFVHDTAIKISNAAQQKNMPEIITEYHTLIDGCQSCHTNYKQSVSDLLNEN